MEKQLVHIIFGDEKIAAFIDIAFCLENSV